MKVVRVTKEEFETENGVIYPMITPLEKDISIEEFQKIYDKSCDIIKSIQDFRSDNTDSEGLEQ